MVLNFSETKQNKTKKLHRLSGQPVPDFHHPSCKKKKKNRSFCLFVLICLMTFQLNILCFNWCPLYLVLLWGAMRSLLSLLYAPWSVIYVHWQDPPKPFLLHAEHSQPSPYNRCSSLLPSLLPFAGLSPVCACISCPVEPSAGYSTSDVPSQGWVEGKIIES